MTEVGNGRSRVVLMPCDSYEEEAVYQALKAGISLLGGLEALVKREERVRRGDGCVGGRRRGNG